MLDLLRSYKLRRMREPLEVEIAGRTRGIITTLQTIICRNLLSRLDLHLLVDMISNRNSRRQEVVDS